MPRIEVQICVVSDCLIVVTRKINLFSAMIYDIGGYFYSQASVQSGRKVCMMVSNRVICKQLGKFGN